MSQQLPEEPRWFWRLSGGLEIINRRQTAWSVSGMNEWLCMLQGDHSHKDKLPPLSQAGFPVNWVVEGLSKSLESIRQWVLTLIYDAFIPWGIVQDQPGSLKSVENVLSTGYPVRVFILLSVSKFVWIPVYMPLKRLFFPCVCHSKIPST